MIKNIIDLLALSSCKGTGSQEIEIAKGKFYLPRTLAEIRRKISRMKR